MDMYFIEPNNAQTETVPIVAVVERLSISPEDKEWLLGFFQKGTTFEPKSDFERDFLEIINRISELDPAVFKPMFLFDDCTITRYPDFFDLGKLSCERKGVIPELFTREADGKPSIFRPYVAHILDNIRDYTNKDKIFSKAYQQKLQEVRENSSFEERAICYIKLVFEKLFSHTGKVDEISVTPEEIDAAFNLSYDEFYRSTGYSVKLVAELEEIPEEEMCINYFIQNTGIRRYDIQALPFIICGKEVYSCIHKVLRFVMLCGDKCSADDIAQLDIPRWDERDYIHEIYLNIALTLSEVSRDKAMLLLNRIFEGVNAKDIPYIFFEYIQDSYYSSFYGMLLKKNYADRIRPIRSELERLDRMLRVNAIGLYKADDLDRCHLFLDYIKGLVVSVPDDKIALFQELSFLRTRDKTIKDILDYPDRYKETNKLYEEFVDIIARGMAEYSVRAFLPFEYRGESLNGGYTEYDLDIFRRYCEKLTLKNSDDALFVAKYWFLEFHNHHISYLSGDTFSKFAKDEDLFYKNIFCRFISDEDTVCRFLSIPLVIKQYSTSQVSQNWILYYLAGWICRMNDGVANIFDAAFQRIKNKEFVFTEKIYEFVRSNGIFSKFLEGSNGIYEHNNLNRETKYFLYSLFAALGGDWYHRMLKNINSADECFPFYLIRYRYSHEDFDPLDFFKYLFTIKNSTNSGGGDEVYPIELIREACREGILAKHMILEKVTAYINNHLKALMEYRKIKNLVLYFFITKEEKDIFFLPFCERAAQETENSYEYLFAFLKLRSYFLGDIDYMLDDHEAIVNHLITRCGKMLNVFRKCVEQNKFHYEYVFAASIFIWEKTGNIWKAVKPLFLTFRSSKEVLLSESLSRHSTSPLFGMIIFFFNIENKEKLKELRYDMANDFAEYLKEAKKERQTENYTQIERGKEGFDPNYTEPSPFWRYAYIRALGDLGVKTDKRGHFFREILKKVSQNDPSEQVKSAAEKTASELDAIRGGYSGNNHKKCLFEAFWWLRQAHMLSLGAKIDDKKALGLRIKEWR